MSMSNSYRYEIITEKHGMRLALERQKEIIKADQSTKGAEENAKFEREVRFRAEWDNKAEQLSFQQKMKSDAKQTKAELQLLSSASVQIRRAALRQLLQEEHAMYDRQLRTVGKTFQYERK